MFMHLALFTFFIGLVIFIWGDRAAIVDTVMTICVICVLLYLGATILPLFTDSPFGTPISYLLRKVFFPPAAADPETQPHSRNDEDTRCLAWMMTQSTKTNVINSAAMAVSGLDGTDSQQKILHKGGIADIIAKSLASCTVEQHGRLVIRREDLDTASLLLFASLRLLPKVSTSPERGDTSYNLVELLKQFDHDKFIEIRKDFNIADFAAACWCLVAFRFLQVHYPLAETPSFFAAGLVNQLKIPERFAPCSSRLYTDMLRPSMEIAEFTTQDEPQLLSWAVKAMFAAWRSAGCPDIGEVGRSVLSRAAMAVQPDATSVLFPGGHFRFSNTRALPKCVEDIIAMGGTDLVARAAISGRDEIAVQAATAALAYIAKSDDGRKAIVDCKAIEQLAAAAISGQDEIAVQAAKTLALILKSDNGTQAIIDCKAIEQLAAAAISGQDEIAVQAAKALLALIAESYDGRKAIQAAKQLAAAALSQQDGIASQSQHHRVAQLAGNITQT